MYSAGPKGNVLVTNATAEGGGNCTNSIFLLPLSVPENPPFPPPHQISRCVVALLMLQMIQLTYFGDP